MTIELNDYGLMIDLGDFLYVSLSWVFITLSAVILVGVKVYNKIKSKKETQLITLDDDDDWMTK